MLNENLVGQVILGQFRVDAFLASGGMGTVYRVWDLKRNVPLAMKVLHVDFADDPAVLRYLQREAEALENLAHPNIVPFYGLYETDGFAFLVQRYIDGPTLQQVLRKRAGQPLPLLDSLAYLKAIGAAIGYAHTMGVIHNDAKPGNVLIDWGGHIYLSDFGVSRHIESTGTTWSGAGTPAYMAPEQIRGENVRPETDIYALGIMAFEMFTGRRPFTGQLDEAPTGQAEEPEGRTSIDRVREAHLHRDPPDPRSLNPALPPALAPVLLKALAKDPAERYPTTHDFFQAVLSAAEMRPDEIPNRVNLVDEMNLVLTPPAQGLSDEQTRPGSAGAPAPGYGSTIFHGPVLHEQPAPLASRRWIWWLGGLALAAVLGITLAFANGVFGRFGVPGLLSRQDETRTPGSTPFPTQSASAPAAPALFPTPVAVNPSPFPTQAPTQPHAAGGAPPGGYDLAFASDRSGEFNVVLMNSADPSQWLALAPPEGVQRSWWPSFCGDRLGVETSGPDDQPQWIYWMSLTGAAERWTPPNAADELGVPRCSPDGRYLAYSAKQGQRWSFWVGDLQQPDSFREIVTPPGMTFSGYASWTLRGSFFYMAGSPDGYDIRVNETIEADSDRVAPGKYPAASPQGDRVAYVCRSDGGICILDLARGETISVTNGLRNIRVDGNFPPEGTPAWSADGEWVYFTSAGGQDLDIFRVRPDGSDLQNLTEDWESNEIMPALRW